MDINPLEPLGVVRPAVYAVYGAAFFLLAGIMLIPILQNKYPVSSRAYQQILKAALLACIAACADQFYWCVISLVELHVGLQESVRSWGAILLVKGIPAAALCYLLYKVVASGPALHREFKVGYSGPFHDVSAGDPKYYSECYVVACMPFAKIKVASDVWELAIRTAAEAAGLKAHRADDAIPMASIVDTVFTEIAYSHAVIADVTGANPNVLHELGWAQMLNKPIILISQAGAARLPAMLKHLHVIEYDQRDLAHLSDELASVLRRTKVSQLKVVNHG